MHAQKIIERLELQPHPREDGYFRETYRSEDYVRADLPARYRSQPEEDTKTKRCFSTAILFMIVAGKFSALHRLQSEEIFHFHAGGPAELTIIREDGSVAVHTLSSDFAAGHEVQVVVPRNSWQALKLASDAAWILVGCTVSPGFDYADYEDANRDELVKLYPQHAVLIEGLVLRR